MDAQKVGRRIQEGRKSRGLTQAELSQADVLDVTTGQESGLVSRKLLALPPEEQRRILRVLEVMIEESGKK